MANLLHTDVLDSGLNVLTNATSTVLHLCSTQPATFGNVATYTCGNKTSPTIGSPAAAGTGRKVTVAAVTTGGSLTATTTATHWAIVDSSRLLATGALSAGQAVTSGNSWTATAFDITIAQPA